MTPEEARALLDGTTPGPWELSSSRSVDGIDIVMYDGTEMERQNVALAAAAPTLAAMVAGMREEWGVEVTHALSGDLHTRWGYDDRKDAESFARYMLSDPRWYPVRVIRRYVTEPEEA